MTPLTSHPVRLLVANGCSYTRGAELGRAQDAWPTLVANALDVPWVNLGCDGGSNRRVVRTTVGQLDRLAAEHRVSVEEVLVICMWTGLSRHECFTRRRDKGHGYRPNLPDELRWHRLSRWRIQIEDQLSEAYYRHLWSAQGAMTNFALDWLMLDGYLRSRGVQGKYVFAWDVLRFRQDEQTRRLLSGLDPATVYGGSVTNSRTSFYTDIIGRFPTGDMQHPLEEAHASFSSSLTDWLRDHGIRDTTPKPW
ncbi:DUF6071 family protein [Streptomyces sp. NPDC006660]|uniref:DUF6071 family protein n=1 Tax=unclassified Streptomyces TaxID=2593676 RepID=UPI002E8181F9|nr:DUF6071 family protein [Streptomyces sp. NBC_00523]WUD04091.1 hypothetical protein OHS17_32550 [Streptomyces sp. NBC_00523]